MGERGPIGHGAGHRRGRYRGRASVVALPPKPAAPPVPPGLLQWTQRVWRDFWESDLARFVSEADRPALVRLMYLYDEQRRSMRGYRSQRLVAGSRGQPVLNPLLRALVTIEPTIRNLEKAFGITPNARARLGLQIGQAYKTLDELNAEVARQVKEERGGRLDDDPRVLYAERAIERGELVPEGPA